MSSSGRYAHCFGHSDSRGGGGGRSELYLGRWDIFFPHFFPSSLFSGPSSSVSLFYFNLLFPCAGVRENTCARVPHFLQPY